MLTEKIFAAAQNGAEYILIFLIILSFLSVAMIAERFLTLRKVLSKSDKIKARLMEIMQTSSFSDLEDLSKDKESIEGRALSYAFRFYKEKNVHGVAELFNSFIVIERPRLEKYLNYLATIGSNAPFVGLLGTVLGIMKAFNDLGVNQGNASTIMVGIAEALVATAVGLFVAIPAVVAFNYFQKQVKSTIQNIEGVRELFLAHTKQGD